MLNLEYQTQFKKDMKTIIKRGLDINLLKKLLTCFKIAKNSLKFIGIINYLAVGAVIGIAI